MAGLYVHIPFCESRCIYCGFYSTVGTNLHEEYVDALLKEFHERRERIQEPFSTVYLGGGTPSTLPTPYLNKLFDDILEGENPAEITMECNPDDVTPEFARWIGQSPVNRVSMGAQTFNDERLNWIHRRHTSRQVCEAVRLLRENGIKNLSLDLMFGFPKESIEEWQYDIDCALALHPEHISAYSLMYEEDTPLYKMLDNGEIEEIDEELSLQMYDMLIDKLTEAGYEHYEISNFALPGFRSRHNSSYWRQTPYLGIGAAAHSYDGEQRWWNISDIRKYIKEWAKECNSLTQYEDIDEKTRYNDIITTALRTCEGINLNTLSISQREYLLSQAKQHISAGKLKVSSNYVHLTRSGIYTSDDIMTDLILL